MRFDRSFYKIYIYLLIIFFIGTSIFIYKQIFRKKEFVISPIPNFLTAFSNNQVYTLDLWSPIFEMLEAKKTDAPMVTAKSALLYDLTSKKILFSKNPEKKLPMASLTKIMTMIVAIESGKLDDKYLVSKADLVGENSMGLTVGEKLSLKELLYGLILTSGNDAAEVLASNFHGGRDKFIIAMNNKVKALGLNNTHFTNPTGLEGDGSQYTTSFDLLVITNYALQFPIFKEVVGTFVQSILYSENHKAFYLENQTNLISSYPGVFGVKDGYTPEAGLCLVTYLKYKGHEIIGILLGSDNRRQEMKDLLDHGLKLQGITPPPHE